MQSSWGNPSSLHSWGSRAATVMETARMQVAELIGASADAIVSYTAAFEEVKARADFAEISAKRLGVYPQMTGDEATGALGAATEVPGEAKAYVVDWLKDRYGVSLN